MPVNLELKAKYPNIKRAEAIACEFTQLQGETIGQVDTYFLVPHGRLKLREIEGQGSELIWYDRDESEMERISHYERCPVHDTAVLRTLLERAFGVDVTVRKKRTVYVWNNCRIHIDMVDTLGPFVEFEVLNGTDDDAQERMKFLVREFGITELDIVNCSYADLVRTLTSNY